MDANGHAARTRPSRDAPPGRRSRSKRIPRDETPMVILFLFFAETESATFVYVEAQMSLRQTESVLATQWDAALEGSAQCGRPTEPLPLAAQPWRRLLLGPGGGARPVPVPGLCPPTRRPPHGARGASAAAAGSRVLLIRMK